LLSKARRLHVHQAHHPVLTARNTCRPQVYGEVPMTRFRHTGVVITAEPTSKIGALVNQVLKPLQREAEDGSVVLLFGGYNTMGQEFGGDQFEVGYVGLF